MNSPVQIWRSHKKLHKYLGKQGKLLVWTKIFVAPLGFEHQVPYIVGIVQFDPSTDSTGPSATSSGPSGSGQAERLPIQVVDCEEEDLKVNQKVITVIRKVGKAKAEDVIEYGIKVKPRS